MADYPGAVYSPRTKQNKPGIEYNAAKTTIGYAEDITKLDDEVVAVETELDNNKAVFGVDIVNKKIIIKSADGSDRIEIFHDNANAQFETTEGMFNFQGSAIITEALSVAPAGGGVKIGHGGGMIIGSVANPANIQFIDAPFVTTVINSLLTCNGNFYLGANSITEVANVYLNGSIYNYGDPNTRIYFGSSDVFYITCGGVELARFAEGAQDGVIINEYGVDVDFRAEGLNDTHLIFAEAETDKVGIGVSGPQSKLQVGGAISSATLVFSDLGPTDDLDVSEVNTLFINAGANAVTIGGLVGGVDGQILNIVIIDGANPITLEHAEGGGDQDIYLHNGADETLDGEYGGWTLICYNGVDWYDVSHAKHV